MNPLSLVFSNGIEYKFDVYVTTLNQTSSTDLMVFVSWNDTSWSTSFNESELVSRCEYIIKYLVGDSCTVEDAAKLYFLFLSILNISKQ